MQHTEQTETSEATSQNEEAVLEPAAVDETSSPLEEAPTDAESAPIPELYTESEAGVVAEAEVATASVDAVVDHALAEITELAAEAAETDSADAEIPEAEAEVDESVEHALDELTELAAESEETAAEEVPVLEAAEAETEPEITVEKALDEVSELEVDSIALETLETPEHEEVEAAAVGVESNEAPTEFVEGIVPEPVAMADESLQSAIEAIIFSSDKSVSVARLREVFGEEGPSEDSIRLALEALMARFKAPQYGIELRPVHGGFHFVTKAENAELIRRFHASKPFRLGRSALETMAIVAYRQPVTRAEIDQIRGIDSSHLMRTLIERGLVKMAGKADVPGRPVQYGTTERFLEILGMKDLTELPPLSELEQLQGSVDDPAKRVEEGLQRFMETDIRPETALEQSDEQLDEIGSLIESAGEGSREVFASQVHAEVAAENKAAHEGFLAAFKARRKSRGAAAETVESETAEANASASESGLESASPAQPEQTSATPTPTAEATAEISYEDLVPSTSVN